MVKDFGGQQSLFNQFIAELRDASVQQDSMRFRRNLERVGEIFAYEISKMLPFEKQDVTTPLGVAQVPSLIEQPVLATILRAGLPLHQGLQNFFDKADNAFIAAYRKAIDGDSFDINMEYITSPSLQDRTVILSDPMLATGSSLVLAYEFLKSRGIAKHTHIVSVVASQEGVDCVCEKLKGEPVTLWVGAIDPSLNEKAYIIPGLGDAGDLAFGTKL